ncbi:hypothetical protein [Mitsuaria sp. 7]|uniref:hypothetical protein n=1 Tax=Mitsuaria sp. 7 TaxID=1658665 RepID=UPI0007DD6572|nr:hypothetical protein [Mitsuaria sp. 7]ANH67323.1 hypothetical protein ABE85_06625 [Mitsuaria sp. 7]
MSARMPTAKWQAGLSHAEAVTSLGESLAETALLYRAGLSAVAMSDLVDGDGERVMLCASPALPRDLPVVERMLTMAAHALAGVERKLHASGEAHAAGRPPVILLCLPARWSRAGRHFEINAEGRAFVQRLGELLPERWRGADIEPFPVGRAAGAMALARALQLVEGARDIIWGGVDSQVDWPVLEALAAADRLLTMKQVDGLRPGEAAAFAVVMPGTRADAFVLGLGLGREPAPVGAEAPCRSDGFAQALGAAVAPLRASGQRSRGWWLDTSHESHTTNELQNLIARFGDVLAPRTTLQTPLKELGDAGAATTPLLAALAMQFWAHGVADDDVAVLAAGSDDGTRGALLLAARDPKTGVRQRRAEDMELPA